MNRKMIDEVSFLCHGFQISEQVNIVEEFFQMLQDTDERYVPYKIDMCEPIRTAYSMDAAKKIWIESKEEMGFNSVMFEAPKFWGSISWNTHNSNSNLIILYMKTSMITENNGTDSYLKLAKKLFLWSNSVYGYACHVSKLGGPGSGLTYETCIGDITWMTLFGPPYVKMFGKSIIQSAPCKVEEFAENYFMLLTSEEPTEANTEIIKAQEKVKIHLGEDAFARKEPSNRRFTIEDIRAGRNKRSKEGYRSPDLSEYEIESKIRNDEGLIATINDDGSIITHNGDIFKTVENICSIAIDYGKDFEKNLNYSEETISDVEEILDYFYKDLNDDLINMDNQEKSQERPTESQIYSVAQVWGVYIGEVMRKRIGDRCIWVDEDVPNLGKTLHIKVGGNRIFPIQKAYKRLTNGAEDNVKFFYDVFIKKLSE